MKTQNMCISLSLKAKLIDADFGETSQNRIGEKNTAFFFSFSLLFFFVVVVVEIKKKIEI